MGIEVSKNINILKFTTSFFIAVSLILLSINLLIFNLDFYQTEINKLKIYNQFESKEIVIKQLSEIVRFHNFQAKIDINFYKSDEIRHLYEVRLLILFFRVLTLAILFTTAILISIFAFRKKHNDLISISKISCLQVIFITILFWFLALFFIDQIYNYSHQVLFNYQYSFDPKSSNLIKIFPPEIVVDLIWQASVQVLIIAVACYLILNLVSRRNLKTNAF